MNETRTTPALAAVHWAVVLLSNVFHLTRWFWFVRQVPVFKETAQQPGRMQTASGGGKGELGPSSQRNNDKLIFKDFPSNNTAITKSKYSRFTTKKKKKKKTEKPITSQLTWQVHVKAATTLKRKASFCFTTCKRIVALQGQQKQLDSQKCTTTMRSLDTWLRRVNLTEFNRWQQLHSYTY